MGAVTPLAFSSTLAPLAAGTAVSKRNANTTNSAANQQYQNNVDRINAQQAADERVRAQNLKRQQSSQVAKFGAMGIGSGDGSSAAILKGMELKSDSEAADRARLSTISRDGLSIGYGTNLLSKNSKAVPNNLDKLISSD